MADLRIDRGALGELLEGSDMARELERRANSVERAAKQRCPVDTGRLRSSITHATFTDGQGLVARIGTDVEYAAHVELGTSRTRAQPYLRPALEAGR